MYFKVTLFSALCSVALVGATDVIIMDQCEKGDPMCVEKSFVATSKVGPKKRKAEYKRSKKAQKEHERHYYQKVVATDVVATEKHAAVPIDKRYKKTSDGWELKFTDDGIAGQGLNQNDIIQVRGNKPRTLMSDELECKLPKEVTDKYGFDRKKCSKVIAKVSTNFAQDLNCPKDFNDIDALKKLQAQYDKAPYDVDIKELIVYPINSNSSDIETHLPILCGYNSGYKVWYAKKKFYCESDGTCYYDDASTFSKIEKSPNSFWMSHDKHGDKSYRLNGRLGDMGIVPLGNGVFLQTFKTNRGVFYYGLLLVPKEEIFDKLACKKKEELKLAKLGTIAKALEEEVSLIQRKITALRELKKITKFLHDNPNLNDDSKEKMTIKAIELEKIVAGKQSSIEIEKAKLSCIDDESKDRNITNTDRDYNDQDFETLTADEQVEFEENKIEWSATQL